METEAGGWGADGRHLLKAEEEENFGTRIKKGRIGFSGGKGKA